MPYATLTLQARCAALGFWPGPLDGKHGTRTQAADDAAVASQRAMGRHFMHPSGIHRLHLHWTGGRHKPNAADCKHYHFVFPGDGSEIAANPTRAALSHTLNANGGALGLSCCGMIDARERPFAPGPEPITTASIASMVARAARLCREFDIPVSRYSILMHSEVQPTLGITQRQKWDINWLPGMSAPADPLTVGDRLRALIISAL